MDKVEWASNMRQNGVRRMEGRVLGTAPKIMANGGERPVNGLSSKPCTIYTKYVLMYIQVIFCSMTLFLLFPLK